MLLVSDCTFVCADSSAIERLVGLDIIRGDEDGFRLDESLTRAEFCTLITRMLRAGDYQSPSNPVFSDVPSTHWASGSISALCSMGLISGNGDGTFNPDKGIVLSEAVKVLVCAVGYDAAINTQNAYPNGYLSMASKLGITSSISNDGNSITRMTAAELISNTLDVVPLEKKYGSDDYETNDENLTLYELLMRADDIIEIEGILISNEYSSIREENFIANNGYITIDVFSSTEEDNLSGEVTFKTSKSYNEYLGYRVGAYVKKAKGRYEVVNLFSYEIYNEMTVVDAKDCEISDTHIEYWAANEEKSNKINFESDVIYMYNNRLYKDISSADKVVYNGCYKLLDNDDNNKTDVVFIEEYESFIVERVNEQQHTLYFANKELYRGTNNISHDFDNDQKVFEITDKDGNEMEFSKILPGFGVTVMTSRDDVYSKIMICDTVVTGKVESIDETANTIVVGGQEYELALDIEGKTKADVEISDEASFVFDVFGRIIGIYGDKISKIKYGYVVAASYGQGLDAALSLKILNGASPIKREKVKNGDTNVSYLFQNSEFVVLKCSEKAICYETDEIVNSAEHYVQIFREVVVEPSKVLNRLIGYTTDSKGDVSKIYSYPIPENDSSLGNSQFNASILSFGGEATGNVIGRGYATNSTTQFICIPNHLSPSDDDYFVQLEIADESSGNYVYGVKSFFVDTSSELDYEEEKEIQNGQPVDVLLIRAEMKADNPPPVSQDADICIIGEISATIGKIGNDEGCKVFKLELLNGDKKLIEYTPSEGNAYDVAQSLIKGDLVSYTKDGFGRIARIELIGHVQGLDADVDLNDEREHDYRQEGNMIYGLAKSIERDLYYYNYNEIVDVIYLEIDEELTRKIRVPVVDGPPLYLYEPKGGWIYSATSDDILISESRICAYTGDDGKVSAVVIINE